MPALLNPGSEVRFPEFINFGDPVLIAMLLAAAGYEDEVRAGRGGRWLSFLGTGGTGKTFLANLLYKRCEPRLGEHPTLAWGCFRFVWKTLLGRLHKGDFYLMADLAEANLLLLDEIVVEHDPNGFARDKLAELLGSRVGRWTILTSNLGLETFERIDQRIATRLVRDRNEVRICNTMDFAMRPRAGVGQL